MEKVKASLLWSGPDSDVLSVLVEPPPELWEARLIDSGDSIYLELDENEVETGRVVGIELTPFLRFAEWDSIPGLPMLWQLSGEEPLPLDELLKRKQRELRSRSTTTVERR